MFANNAKGFHFRFANGVTVSVQYGAGNYCEHRDEDFMAPVQRLVKGGAWESKDAELCVKAPNAEHWMDPYGWVTPEQAALALGWIASNAWDEDAFMDFMESIDANR